MLAATANLKSIVKQLLDFGANKTLKDADGKTAYDWAMEAGADQEIVDALALSK